ncbi:Protein CBG21037 [Caenorhabditis briggsae]|uniref:Protein CBG21037 n=1 Tax=Caenorhabditis briggsae TaxID=6238 RepID=A8XZ83_CAEBR|nr:Protein CBG21037 [Caenorhabditis briggsae]CAP37950.2 Protein CBG21037 [Caenorhabditis briggsae]
MYTLLALLALAVVPSSGFHFGFPTTTPTLPGFTSIQPTPISTCRIATIGRSIRNVCPTGYTAVTNGECCIASQVTYSTGTTPRPLFPCIDRPNLNGINECPGWRSYCNDVFYKDYMNRNCPQTCGFCSSTSSTPISTCRVATVGRSIRNVCPTGYTAVTNGECCIASQVIYSESTAPTIRPPFSCADRSNTNGINECPGWRSYCNDVFYKDFMARNCPQTCGLCSSTTSSTCIDVVNPTTGRSECAANLRLCNNVAFRDWMKIQCPRTCGYCR